MMGHRANHGGEERTLGEGVTTLFLVWLVMLTPALNGAPAHAAQPCPNESRRAETNSSALPDCRAYELVSPPDAGGAVQSEPLAREKVIRDSPHSGAGEVGGPDLLLGGNLASQLSPPVDVRAGGSAVFWESLAKPGGTGALESGDTVNPFRSVRTTGGWNTKDIFPLGQQVSGVGGVHVALVGASADGATALVATRVALPAAASAFANPRQALAGKWNGVIFYRVSIDGLFPPQLVSGGERLLPGNENMPGESSGAARTPFAAISATPDLGEIAFKSTIALEAGDKCNTSQINPDVHHATTYLWNGNALDGFARQIVVWAACETESPNVAGVPTFLPEGLPVLTPTPGGSRPPGPLVEHGPTLNAAGAYTPLAGPQGGALLSTSPDGTTAYVLSEGNIYAVSATYGWQAAGTPCVSCATDQTGVTYIATSADGNHLLFTTAGSEPGLWEWDASAAHATRLTVAGDITKEDALISENGRYVVALTTAALAGADTNSASDLYLLSAGQPPRLITSGRSAERYLLNAQVPAVDYVELDAEPLAAPAGGVSNDGQRVVYDRDAETGVPEVVDEWSSGQTDQLSPRGSGHGYQVAAVANDLRDVFFLAEDPIVPWDDNAGQPDVYDARIEGGFPPCTPGNPTPPAGAETCAAASETANPTGAPTPGYPSSVGAAGLELRPLPPDSSTPRPAGKRLTRAEKLVRALRACKRRRSLGARRACQRAAQHTYGSHPRHTRGPRRRR